MRPSNNKRLSNTVIGRIGSAVLGVAAGGWVAGFCCLGRAADTVEVCWASASSTATGTSAAGAIDRDRFSAEGSHLWRGAEGQKAWWWQIRFASPRQFKAILQVVGDHPLRLSNAPRDYVWQSSDDGEHWHDLRETAIQAERRMYRLHRLAEPCRAQYLRLLIRASWGSAPALREVELYETGQGEAAFPDWIVVVSTTTQNRTLPGGTTRFVELVRQCPGWENALFQQIWLGDFDEAFASAEPRPLCALLTGNTVEWCQQAHEPWRGVQEVLCKRNLPIWAACGGAQGLAILHETGVDRPWDCPRCRDPKNPKSPVYSHIGHTAPGKCGEYSKNVWERGKYLVRQVARDPVFQGLPTTFEVMESHVGQIAYVPSGWVRVAAGGPGTLTENQCLRVKDRYIYAAQFHIEMPGTPENSRRIMGNFLSLAKQWGGYNPAGRIPPAPEPLCDRAGP